jgi:hypothetical protein
MSWCLIGTRKIYRFPCTLMAYTEMNICHYCITHWESFAIDDIDKSDCSVEYHCWVSTVTCKRVTMDGIWNGNWIYWNLSDPWLQVISSHLRLGLPSGPLFFWHSHQNPIRATCPAHLILLEFIILILLSEKYIKFLITHFSRFKHSHQIT